ncbi:MAG: thioredoxin family protein, partial [Armatimonadota bacterium]
ADVALYADTATISRTVRVPDNVSAAPPTVSVHYQTCDDKVCLPPTTVELPVTLTVATGEIRPEYKDAPQGAVAPKASASAANPAMATADSGATGSELSGPWFFLAAAGAGLLALITPCVFPLIPITLASFAKQANGDRTKMARLAAGYALGVAGLYVGVGGLMSILAGAAGVSQLAANPWVNLFAFAVFVVFALSFFETIQIGVPSSLTGAVHGKARSSQSGLVSLILLGIVFVLASFTCTAPFIGTLLVASAGGERLRPLLGMTVFALAFTSPFLLFALIAAVKKGPLDAAALTRIPKGGAWLARVKATLGFIELAAALKFLSNADMVWGWKLLPQPVLLAAWALLFLLAAMYLLGVVRFGVIAETETGPDRVSPTRGLFAGLFAGIALYCFWGLSGRPLHPAVETFLPPPGYGVGAGAAGSAAHADGLEWMTDYDAALAKAKAEGKPLFIDFTGYTCTNCRWNERNVFPDAGVKEALSKYVLVQLYTDGGADGPKNQKLQETKFGDIALPLYGVVDSATGNVVAKTAGVQTVGGFSDFLTGSVTIAPTTPESPATEASAEAAWAAYSPEAVAKAKAAGKPVVIDFTADWCVNCKQIEKEVFEQPAVAERLSREVVTLRADLTKWADPASAALQKEFGFGALPTIVLLDKDGKENKALRITGRLSVADFEKRLNGISGGAE